MENITALRKINKYSFRLLVIVLFACLSFIGCSSKAKNVYNIDLDNDRREEVVKVKGLKVVVSRKNGKVIGKIDLLDYSEKIEFVDLNKDGKKQIVLWAQGDEGFSQGIVIYGLINNKLLEIFRLDVDSQIEVDFVSTPPVIIGGSTRWIWDGSRFKGSLENF